MAQTVLRFDTLPPFFSDERFSQSPPLFILDAGMRRNPPSPERQPPPLSLPSPRSREDFPFFSPVTPLARALETQVEVVVFFLFIGLGKFREGKRASPFSSRKRRKVDITVGPVSFSPLSAGGEKAAPAVQRQYVLADGADFPLLPPQEH